MNKTEISLFPIFSSLLASQKININTKEFMNNCCDCNTHLLEFKDIF